MMKKNTGITDRFIRLTLAAALVILNLSGLIQYPLSLISWIAAVILAAVAATGFCPIYQALKINTCSRKGRRIHL